MAHYVFLDENNIVTDVIVGVDENELIEGQHPEIWYSNFRGQKCVRTSYNGKIRKQYAGIGYKYDLNADVFIAPKPYPSWFLDTNFDWQPPIAKPNGHHVWDEKSQAWINVEADS